MKQRFRMMLAASALALFAIAAHAVTIDATDVVVPIKVDGATHEVRVAFKDLAYAVAQVTVNAPPYSAVFPGSNFKHSDGHVYTVAADGSMYRDARAWLAPAKVTQMYFIGTEIYAWGAASGKLVRYCPIGCVAAETPWQPVTSYPNGLLDKVPPTLSSSEVGAGPTFAGRTPAPWLTSLPTPVAVNTMGTSVQ